MKCPIGCNSILTNEGEDHTKALAHFDKCPKMMVKCDVCCYTHFPNQSSQMECVMKLLSVIKEKDHGMIKSDQHVYKLLQLCKEKDSEIEKLQNRIKVLEQRGNETKLYQKMQSQHNTKQVSANQTQIIDLPNPLV